MHSPPSSCVCADLKELRKLLGTKACPNCHVDAQRHGYDDCTTHPPMLRHELYEVVQEARELRATAATRTAVRRVLRGAGLQEVHVFGVCPFLKIPHFSLAGFVPERLHERW